MKIYKYNFKIIHAMVYNFHVKMLSFDYLALLKLLLQYVDILPMATIVLVGGQMKEKIAKITPIFKLVIL